jgi:hypothetical protein
VATLVGGRMAEQERRVGLLKAGRCNPSPRRRGATARRCAPGSGCRDRRLVDRMARCSASDRPRSGSARERRLAIAERIDRCPRRRRGARGRDQCDAYPRASRVTDEHGSRALRRRSNAAPQSGADRRLDTPPDTAAVRRRLGSPSAGTSDPVHGQHRDHRHRPDRGRDPARPSSADNVTGFTPLDNPRIDRSNHALLVVSTVLVLLAAIKRSSSPLPPQSTRDTS